MLCDNSLRRKICLFREKHDYFLRENPGDEVDEIRLTIHSYSSFCTG